MRFFLILIACCLTVQGADRRALLLSKKVAAALPETAWVTDNPATSTRNDVSGCVGLLLGPNGANITVSSLGLFVLSGNTESVDVTIRTATDGIIATATFDTSMLSPGWNYLPASCTLTNGSGYRLLRTVTMGGDSWNGEWIPTVTSAAIVTNNTYSATCASFNDYNPGTCFSGVNFKYTAP